MSWLLAFLKLDDGQGDIQGVLTAESCDPWWALVSDYRDKITTFLQRLNFPSSPV
jgi:hypothetical protein